MSSKYLSLFLFLAHVSVSALYATDFHESNDARAMSWAKRAAVMFYRTLPSTTNDISSLEDLTDLEIPSTWGNEPYELDEEERQRFVRAPPLPRLGKFRRYLDDFKDLGRSHDWISSIRDQKHLSPEAEGFFRDAVCTEFGDVKEFSLFCKRR